MSSSGLINWSVKCLIPGHLVAIQAPKSNQFFLALGLTFYKITMQFVRWLLRHCGTAVTDLTQSAYEHRPAYLKEHVEGQESEAQIVKHKDASTGVWLPTFHVLGPHPDNQKVHDCQSKGWWVVVQQQPASYPLILKMTGKSSSTYWGLLAL